MQGCDTMRAQITNIQGYSIHDGPGIRTVAFLKGCGLKCQWCANPEGISGDPDIGFIENLCKFCGRCLDACPEGALNLQQGQARVDYFRCKTCGKCVDACYYRAMVLYGKEMSAEEVFDAVRRDKMFYDGSGGGVTVSGGEPLLRAPFVKELFELCHGDGINTCVETSGFVRQENLELVLPVTDYLLFDLKHLNSELHKLYTGQPNDLILSNAKLASESNVKVLFRMPLIPTVNDTPENIRETAEFLKSLPPEAEIQLMPYHRLGDSKYKALNKVRPLQELQIMKDDQVNEIKQAFIDLGVKCTISK